MVWCFIPTPEIIKPNSTREVDRRMKHFNASKP